MRSYGWATCRSAPSPVRQVQRVRLTGIMRQLAKLGLSEPAFYRHRVGGTNYPVTLSVRELPSSQVAGFGGEINDRWLDVFVVDGDNAPAFLRDGLLEFAATSEHAGTWKILDDERYDSDSRMVRAQLSKRENVNAAGARRVVR